MKKLILLSTLSATAPLMCMEQPPHVSTNLNATIQEMNAAAAKRKEKELEEQVKHLSTEMTTIKETLTKLVNHQTESASSINKTKNNHQLITPRIDIPIVADSPLSQMYYTAHL